MIRILFFYLRAALKSLPLLGSENNELHTRPCFFGFLSVSVPDTGWN